MRSFAVALLALLPLTPGLAAQAPVPVSTRSISGSVSDARDNAALRRARIVLLEAGRQIDTVFTDDEGRFAFPSAPATAVTIRVSKAGYASSAAAVAAGRVSSEQRFSLPRTAAVMGRVAEVNGSPVSAAYVTARPLDPSGRPLADTLRLLVQTDRLGEYRLGGLASGRYEITGVRIPPEVRIPAGRLEDRLFDPLDLDVGTPVTVTVNSGDEARNVDFTVPGENEICATGPSVRPPEGAPAARIEGRVTTDAGVPISCAIVRIVFPASPVPQVYTDRQGRFEIDGLPEDTYVLSAMKSGYLPLRYGQRTPSDDASPVTARTGSVRRNVDIRLPRESVVTGTVVDEHGEPFEGMQVWAMVVPRAGGPLLPAFTAVSRPSDDRGQFRVIGLTPGTYVIRTMVGGSVGAPDRPLAYVPSYHPGGTDVTLATRITVEAGRDASGADIVLSSVFTADVSGIALDPAGRPYAGSLSLSSRLRSAAALLETRSTTADATGAFVFRDVPRGDYVIRAPAPPSDGTTFAVQPVTITDNTPAPITLLLKEGARLEGRILFETEPGANLAGMTLSFIPEGSDVTPGGFGRTQFGREPDGSFRMSGLAGPVRVTLGGQLPACDTCYLKSAVVNGRDAVDTAFDFGFDGGVYRDAEVVVSDAGGTIEGRLVDPPLGSITRVMVMSAYEALRYPGSRYLKTGGVSPTGTFRISGLPPGDYLVGSISQPDASFRMMPTADPDVLDAVASLGTRVTIGERERRTIELRVIRR